MPSSLIFAALAAAWLIVLVPMVAKRRQEVVRTAEAALASRVLRRPDLPHAALRHDQEVRMASERIAERDPALNERRYRPGRGGYDPEVAAQVARAKYVFRQRVVLGLAVAAVVTLVLALAASSLLWWAHAALDLAVIGYLGYLRRQVRIEEEVRQRRAARLAGSRAGMPAPDVAEEAPVEAAHQKEEPIEEPPARSAAV
ncbi:MAG: gephyrin-like molybdotransferase receptor GlpR, partial [Actinomycetes bacterium]